MAVGPWCYENGAAAYEAAETTVHHNVGRGLPNALAFIGARNCTAYANDLARLPKDANTLVTVKACPETSVHGVLLSTGITVIDVDPLRVKLEPDGSSMS